MARTPVVLKDVPSNPSEAQVDDVTLVKGVPGQSLEDEQIERLRQTTGVQLVVEEGGYASQSKDDLQAEAASRGLTVEGTGANGNVTKDDLVAALTAFDEEAGS